MSNSEGSSARAVADLADGFILASVQVAASPTRVFQALASTEVCQWWVREGEFREVDPPRKLVHTWQGAGPPAARRPSQIQVERADAVSAADEPPPAGRPGRTV